MRWLPRTDRIRPSVSRGVARSSPCGLDRDRVGSPHVRPVQAMTPEGVRYSFWDASFMRPFEAKWHRTASKLIRFAESGRPAIVLARGARIMIVGPHGPGKSVVPWPSPRQRAEITHRVITLAADPAATAEMVTLARCWQRLPQEDGEMSARRMWLAAVYAVVAA